MLRIPHEHLKAADKPFLVLLLEQRLDRFHLLCTPNLLATVLPFYNGKRARVGHLYKAPNVFLGNRR